MIDDDRLRSMEQAIEHGSPLRDDVCLELVAELRRLRAEKPKSYRSVEEMLRATQGDELADQVAADIAKKNHANAVDAEKWRSGSLPWVKNVAGGEKPKSEENVLFVFAGMARSGWRSLMNGNWFCERMQCYVADTEVSHWLRITPPEGGDGTAH